MSSDLLRGGLSSEINAPAKRLDQHFEPNVININKYLKHQEKSTAVDSAASATATVEAEDSLDSGDIWRNEKHNWLKGQQQQQQQQNRGGGDLLGPPPQQGIDASAISVDDNWSTTGMVTTNLSIMARRHLSPPKSLATDATGDKNDDNFSDVTSNDAVGDTVGAGWPQKGGRGVSTKTNESSEDAVLVGHIMAERLVS